MKLSLSNSECLNVSHVADCESLRKLSNLMIYLDTYSFDGDVSGDLTENTTHIVSEPANDCLKSQVFY